MTKQRELFCEKLIELKFNATQAAIAAGYSKKTARSKASQLLLEDEVQKYLAELKQEIKKEYDINVAELVNDFKLMKDANITDIFDIEGGRLILKEGKKLSDLPREITGNIKSIKETSNGLAIEMYGRDGALRDLAKIAGLYIERVEHSGGVKIIKDDI